MTKLIITLAMAVTISFWAVTAEAVSFEKTDSNQFGIKPVFGLNLGEWMNKYSYTYGFQLFASGLYQMNLSTNQRIYPEIKTGWLILPHNSESGRILYYLPFIVNFVWDWQSLHFVTKYGQIQVKPYIGLGLYYANYERHNKSTKSFVGGYDVGFNFEYYHPKLNNIYLEMSAEHYFINETDTNLFALMFTIGAGYTYYTAKTKKLSAEDEQVRKSYLEDIMTDDEQKIISASVWLGKNKEKSVIERLKYLLSNDKRRKVRLNAAFGLGLIEEPEVLDTLLYALQNDENRDVKHTCLMSISRIGPTKEIMKSLKQYKKETADPQILDQIGKMEKMFKE
jgi:hypothetical protein